MSLVTTAMSYLSRSAWHSARVSAVLPEPTGPPMPTRRGGGSAMRQAGREVAPFGFRQYQRLLHHCGDAAAERQQDALAGGLAERYGLQRRHHLVFAQDHR
jgi:hypothetical protein